MSNTQVYKLQALELIKRHQLHDGVYARLAKRLRVDASYVSRVARGKRDSPDIFAAVVKELKRIDSV